MKSKMLYSIFFLRENIASLDLRKECASIILYVIQFLDVEVNSIFMYGDILNFAL